MRIVKFKIFTVAVLLICFMAAGAILIWQESAPEKIATAQSGFAIYSPPNLLEIQAANASEPEEKRVESPRSHASFVLWLTGLPLGVLGGIAIGLTFREGRHFKKTNRRVKMQYVVLNAAPGEEFSNTVSEELIRAAQLDTAALTPAGPARTARNCRMRFRAAMVSSPRENQPR